MSKMLTILLICGVSLFAQNILKYEDESKFDYFDPRIFVGFEGSYNRTNVDENIDKSVYGYGLYMGMPIFNYESMFKVKTLISSDYDMNLFGLSINFPFKGTAINELYFGFAGGVSKIKFKDRTKLNLEKSQSDGEYYGIHVGLKNKYTRNLFIRYEIEYLRHDISSKKDSGTDLELKDSIEFLAGVEYRF